MMFELFLIENRIEFLKKQHANGIDTSHDQHAFFQQAPKIIDHFATHADPTPNKQYTQWVVGQYKKKNIRQEDAHRINDTLTNFHTYKHKLLKKDINAYSTLSDVEQAVQPHIGTPATKAEEAHSGLEVLHKDDKYQVNLLKTKEASIVVYGGGGHSSKKLGTSWCTAADSNNNMFHNYSIPGETLHTIHVEDDPKSPYQFHSLGQFMNRHDEEVDPREFIKTHKALQPHLEGLNHIFDVDGKFIDQGLDHSKSTVRAAVAANPAIKDYQLTRALDDKHWKVRLSAMKNPNAKLYHVRLGLNDHDEDLRAAAAMHPSAGVAEINQAMDDAHWKVRSKALKNPNSLTRHVSTGLTDHDEDVRAAAAEHPKISNDQLEQALRSENHHVRAAAYRNPNISHQQLMHAFDEDTGQLAYNALNHSVIGPEHLTKALEHPDSDVVHKALTHPLIDATHISQALSSSYWATRYQALLSKKVTPEHLKIAINDADSDVRERALTHANMTPDVLEHGKNSKHLDVVYYSTHGHRHE